MEKRWGVGAQDAASARQHGGENKALGRPPARAGCKAVAGAGGGDGAAAVCVRACGLGPGRAAWRDRGGQGTGPGRGGRCPLAERAPGDAGEGQVGVWLKEGRSGVAGRGGGVCSSARTCAGDQGPRAPRVRAGAGWEGRPGDPRPSAAAHPAAQAAPPRYVQLSEMRGSQQVQDTELTLN